MVVFPVFVVVIIAVPVVIPIMLVLDVAVRSLPVAFVEPLAIVARYNPHSTRVGRPAPIAFMPAPRVPYDIPVTSDPDITCPRRRWDHGDSPRRRWRPNPDAD
jgi:hypothetical protein